MTLVISALEDAVGELSRSMDAGLIPEVGSNIAYALPDARDKDDVAAVQGRIVRLSGQPHPVGPVDFGASDHVARIVLTAMKFDPGYTLRGKYPVYSRRSSGSLRICCWKPVHSIAGTSRPEHAPWTGGSHSAAAPVSLMSSSIAGPVGREPMVRILGQDPEEVAAIIGRISNRLRVVHEKTG